MQKEILSTTEIGAEYGLQPQLTKRNVDSTSYAGSMVSKPV